MATTLHRFTDAYATMTVAVYEPLVLRWVSGYSIHVLASTLAWRMQKASRLAPASGLPTAQLVSTASYRAPLPDLSGLPVGSPAPPRPIHDNTGAIVPAESVQKLDLKDFPDAVLVGDKVYPYGLTAVGLPSPSAWSPRVGDPYVGVRRVSTSVDRRLGFVDDGFALAKARSAVAKGLLDAVSTGLSEGRPLAENVRSMLADVGGLRIFEFFPIANIEEALSPIGIARYYRQLYFNVSEGTGPIEQAFTIAPLETLEVVYETTRRQIHDELVEVGTETVSETAVEQKNLDEVSDKVSSMVQRDSSASMSITGSYSTPVWSVGGTASASMSVSTQRSREQATRRLKEVTTRASERITKSFTVKTRALDELTTTNLTRRTIRNESAAPVSYGLRRVLRRVRVKVQDLGPRAVWQLYLRDPGAGLARSRFVHFREAAPIAPPDVPPGLPPKPQGATDTGSASATLEWDSTRRTWFAALVVQTTSDRVVTAVSIDSITDLESGGKEDEAPVPKNATQWGGAWNEATHTFTVNIAIHPGDTRSVSLTYTYSFEPSRTVLDEWEAKRARAVAELTEEALIEQFERAKDLITERSKVQPRPANDLRLEERYEVMNRLVSHLFGRGDDPSEPTPLEIEYFHRYFEIDRMFVYTHPSWWRPRHARGALGLDREPYEITADSDPAPVGSSLGWLIQLDGDGRRNEFLNSPWVRVCLPIAPGREREAIAWLRAHVEGEMGYDVERGPLRDLLAELELVRSQEAALGVNGPNYVTVDSTPGAPAEPQTPQHVYPIIDEFDVTVPTDGFVYDELLLGPLGP